MANTIISLTIHHHGITSTLSMPTQTLTCCLPMYILFRWSILAIVFGWMVTHNQMNERVVFRDSFCSTLDLRHDF